MGQKVVLNYPLVPMGHYNHSFVSKKAKNGSKQVFDNTYFHNLLFYTQVCFMGQQRVINYYMVSPKVSTKLVTPYSYPMGHHKHSFVSKNGRKQVLNVTYLHNHLLYTQVCSMGQKLEFNYPIL
jgi:hypothetical protein